MRIKNWLMCWGALAAAVANAAATDVAAERAAVQKWRAERVARLTSASGWLTPIALYWLKEGDNSFGRDAANAFVVDHAALAADTGVFILKNHQVRYVAHAADALRFHDRAVTALDLVSDQHDQPTELMAGSLHFMLIDRAGHLGIRVRDSVSPKRSEFKGLSYFPIRPQWSIDARFVPYVPAHSLTIVNILGMEEAMSSPGAIVFERDGHTWQLDTILEEPGAQELFVMFSDATSGKETYGAGRFLYVAPANDGRIQVDFNKSFNPPCAFTDFATCPLPPRQNQMALRVDAGERSYAHLH